MCFLSTTFPNAPAHPPPPPPILFDQSLIIFIAPEKGGIECNMLEIILVQVFCPLKIKMTQFLNGFHLKNKGKVQMGNPKLIKWSRSFSWHM